MLAVYPYPPREIEAGLGSPSLFASYVGVLASIYPQVKQFVIGNEPNQPAFWRPQFDAAGNNVSAPAFGPYLAAAYDTLKSVDPKISVVGVGLSPRGNDRPTAKNNISTSPVRFLRALGAWYRRSGRTLPLMDAFSFHPYPNEATDPLERGYAWPNAGFANLDRLKQALWDAFHGTAQPTTLDGLKLHLDEVGWQVDTAGRVGYRGRENVSVTDEVTQACHLWPADPGGGVRPGRRVAQLLRVPRRRPAHGLPGRARARGRLGEACGRRRAGGDRRRRVPGLARDLVAWRRGRGSEGRGGRQGSRRGHGSRRRRGGRARQGLCSPDLRAEERAAAAPSRSPGCARSNVAVRVPGEAVDRVEVSVHFAAESNRTRRTRRRSASRARAAEPALDIEQVFVP